MPSYREALAFWLKLGFINFGGPAGQIAIMQHELVDERRWINQASFLHALNFCMLLPGPEAQQLATYIGWRLHGLKGALTAGILFVVPGAVTLFVLAWIAAAYGKVGFVAAVFMGLKPVVVAIVAHAVWRIGKRSLNGWPALTVAAASFIAIQFLGAPFPLVVLLAGVIGWIASRGGHSPFAPVGHGDAATVVETPANAPWRRLAVVAASYVVLLAVPVTIALALFGPSPFLTLAHFFTQAAFVTFGGAYAVLPYVATAAVQQFHWLSPDEMINGLALAETTPGPLILVLEYVGFFAGWNAGVAGTAGGLSPIAAASIGAVLTTYVTFLPSIMLILAGAPFIERIARIKAAAGALGAITAAVVGVILTLAVFLGRQTVIDRAGQVDWPNVAVLAVSLAVLIRYKISLHWLVLGGAVYGLLRANLF